jgi:transposase-like protein
MNGKPWSVEEENRLKQMLQADKSVRVIAKVMGKTRDCIRKKIARLGLEVVVHAEKSWGTTTSTSLVLPGELPSVEEALKDLVEAKTPLSVIAKKLGVSEESARAKICRLGLEEVEQRKNACSSSSEFA